MTRSKNTLIELEEKVKEVVKSKDVDSPDDATRQLFGRGGSDTQIFVSLLHRWIKEVYIEECERVIGYSGLM